MQFHNTKSGIPEERIHRVRILGTGAATPTRELGQGIVVSRTGTGAYTLTWAENPGTFVNADGGFGAVTPADVKGHTFTRGVYSNSAGVYSLAIAVFNASDAADDLQATEYLDLELVFSELALSQLT